MSNGTQHGNTVVPLLLRLALAVIFVSHGYSKVSGRGNEWGATWAITQWKQQQQPPEAIAAAIHKEAARLEKEMEKAEGDDTAMEELESRQEHLGYTMARVRLAYSDLPDFPTTLASGGVQMLVAWGELLGGIALLIGLLTRIAAGGLALIQVGAIVFVTGARGFAPGVGVGYEYNLALIAMCVAVVLLGGGLYALDRIRERRARATAANKASHMSSV